MPGAKTKAISLKARRFQKYQLFLSFSAHIYEIYFSDVVNRTSHVSNRTSDIANRIKEVTNHVKIFLLDLIPH